MRHRVFGNQLGRNTKQARALYRSLVSELLDHGKIETTLAKAKSVNGMVDRVINFAKKNTLSARREFVKVMGNDKLSNKVFSQVAPKLANRQSGYSRIIRLGKRFSDTTEKVILELVEGIETPIAKNETKETGSTSTPLSVNEIKEKTKESGKKKTVKKKV